MKKGKLIILPIICSMIIAGCGRQDVDMTVSELQGAIDGGTFANAAESEVSNTGEDTGRLMSELGIKETKWKETLGYGDKKVIMSATISVPNADSMYVIKVKEHYYSNEEKKTIAEAIFDKDSIRVNVDSESGKEWCRQALNICELSRRTLDSSDRNGVWGYINDEECRYMTDMLTEIATTKMAESAQSESITEDVGDYSANHYIGMRDGHEYTLDFYVNPDGNASSWHLLAENPNEFFPGYTTYRKSVIGEVIDYYPTGTVNKCELSAEEAAAPLVDIASKIGIDYMSLVTANTIHTIGMDNESGESDLIMDGYELTLAREYMGSFCDPRIHYSNAGAITDADARPAYPRERAYAEVNEYGIMRIDVEGQLDIVGEPEKAGLLGFEDVKVCIGEIASDITVGVNTNWSRLLLTYARIPSADEPDTYSYVPVWRVSHDATTFDYSPDIAEDNAWVNAIDGSKIEPLRNSDVDYLPVQELLLDYYVE